LRATYLIIVNRTGGNFFKRAISAPNPMMSSSVTEGNLDTRAPVHAMPVTVYLNDPPARRQKGQNGTIVGTMQVLAPSWPSSLNKNQRNNNLIHRLIGIIRQDYYCCAGVIFNLEAYRKLSLKK
jgi:hypothetical protein